MYAVRCSVHDVRRVIVEAPTEKEALARATDALNEDGHAGELVESDILAVQADEVLE